MAPWGCGGCGANRKGKFQVRERLKRRPQALSSAAEAKLAEAEAIEEGEIIRELAETVRVLAHEKEKETSERELAQNQIGLGWSAHIENIQTFIKDLKEIRSSLARAQIQQRELIDQLIKERAEAAAATERSLAAQPEGPVDTVDFLDPIKKAVEQEALQHLNAVVSQLAHALDPLDAWLPGFGLGTKHESEDTLTTARTAAETARQALSPWAAYQEERDAAEKESDLLNKLVEKAEDLLAQPLPVWRKPASRPRTPSRAPTPSRVATPPVTPHILSFSPLTPHRVFSAQTLESQPSLNDIGEDCLERLGRGMDLWLISTRRNLAESCACCTCCVPENQQRELEVSSPAMQFRSNRDLAATSAFSHGLATTPRGSQSKGRKENDLVGNHTTRGHRTKKKTAVRNTKVSTERRYPREAPTLSFSRPSDCYDEDIFVEVTPVHCCCGTPKDTVVQQVPRRPRRLRRRRRLSNVSLTSWSTSDNEFGPLCGEAGPYHRRRRCPVCRDLDLSDAVLLP